MSHFFDSSQFSEIENMAISNGVNPELFIALHNTVNDASPALGEHTSPEVLSEVRMLLSTVKICIKHIVKFFDPNYPASNEELIHSFSGYKDLIALNFLLIDKTPFLYYKDTPEHFEKCKDVGIKILDILENVQELIVQPVSLSTPGL